MITSFKNRTIDPTKKVFVYRNLHKKQWSIKQFGLVVGHAEVLLIRDAEFKVGEAGRQRVLQEKKKNVHAGIFGYVANPSEIKATYQDDDHIHYHLPVEYNPYPAGCFYSRDHGPVKTINKADWVDMDIREEDKVLAIWES
jgi:hypothetical protein